MFILRKEWEQLDQAKELIEDGPISYLSDDEVLQLITLIDTMESRIRDVLSIKELGNYHMNKRRGD